MSSPKDIHAADQNLAAMVHLGALVARFYTELIDNEVPPDHACALTASYLTAMVGRAHPDA